MSLPNCRFYLCYSVIWLLGALVCGCSSDLSTQYGRRTGSAASSVNGTTVLGEMFAKAGHGVRSWSVLSPSLHDADVIVWAPNDFEMPPATVQAWLEDWLLYSYEDKILIYIGRDYDAAPQYWQFAKQNAPPSQQREVARRLFNAKQRARKDRSDTPDTAEWPNFFSVDGTAKHEKITTLSGPWAKDIDAAKASIEHQARLTPSEDADILLATGDGTPLLSEIVFNFDKSDSDEIGYDYSYNSDSESRLIIVENGSFLLNMPLVNHEHRKIAGKLVGHIGKPKKRVVFLQSYSGGPAIRDTDPDNHPPTGLALFSVWPLSGVIVHLAMLGFVYAMACWPVFGVPRHLGRESLTDFGAHVGALGNLLSKTGDISYAHNALMLYRQTVLKEDIPLQSTPGVAKGDSDTSS